MKQVSIVLRITLNDQVQRYSSQQVQSAHYKLLATSPQWHFRNFVLIFDGSLSIFRPNLKSGLKTNSCIFTQDITF